MSVNLETLEQLARERSPDRRRELVQTMAQAFFAAPQRSAREIDLFDHIMDKVLAEVEPLARRELAEQLADQAVAPQRTLLRLAGDVIEVAAPVLSRSPALHDDHLERIARSRSQDHLIAIARRKAVSERVTDILVDRGNDAVACAVSENEGARFSEAGLRSLAVRATANVAILNRLVRRSNLPERVANELVPVLAGSIAERITSTPLDNEFSAHRLITEARALLSERLRAALTRARPLGVLSDQVGRGNLTMSEAVTELADADELGDLAALIGTGLRMPVEVVVSNLFLGDETMMLLCRAATLDVNAFSAILRMRARRRRGSTLEFARVIDDYLRIPQPIAANVMRTVRDRAAVA